MIPTADNVSSPAHQFAVHQSVLRNARSQKQLRRIGSNCFGSAVGAVQVHEVRNLLRGRNFDRVAE